MKDIRTIVRFVGIWGFIFLLAGCSSEETGPVVEPAAVEKVVTPETAPIRMTIGGVTNYVTPFDELMEQTRAWVPPTGFVPYENGNQIIHVAFTKDDAAPRKGYFFRSGENWNMSLEEDKDLVGGDYYLYGYMPYMPNVTFSITDRDETESTGSHYSQGAKITLHNVPTAISQDLCVAIASKHGPDKEHDAGLRQGDFKFTFQGLGGSAAADNYVFMLLDHLYAGLRLRMRVKAEYLALRTIKLKALRLNAKAGSTLSTEKNNITIELMATDGTDPIVGEITYTPVGEVATGGVEFWSSAEGLELGTDFVENLGDFMPLDVTSLELTSVYDVYDKKGNLIRENSEAKNSMLISDLFDRQTTTLRDCRYTVNMTIQPTYLYMLSDPDLDSPSVAIE